MSIKHILEEWRGQQMAYDPAPKSRSERIDELFADLVAFVIKSGSSYQALQKGLNENPRDWVEKECFPERREF